MDHPPAGASSPGSPPETDQPETASGRPTHLRSRRAGRLRGWPLGLLGAIGLIAALESAILGRVLELIDDFQWDWRRTGRLVAEDEVAGADLLCFGDSQLKLAVIPQVVERRLGLSAYNLALVGGQAPASYFLLRRVLEAGHRPEAVVVDYFPQFLRSGPRDYLHLAPHLTSLRESIDLGLAAGDPELLGRLVVSGLLPSVRLRSNLRNHIRVSLAGQEASRLLGKARLLRNWRLNRGAQLMPSQPELAYDPDQWRRYNFPDTRWHPVALAYIDRFLKLADRHGITVYWLVPPAATALQAECERSGFQGDYDRFLRGVVERYPNVVILDGRSRGYADDVFFDPHHLGREGAFALTHALCDLLEDSATRTGDDDRWVALPSYQERPIDLALEHVEDSHQIAVESFRALKRR